MKERLNLKSNERKKERVKLMKQQKMKKPNGTILSCFYFILFFFLIFCFNEEESREVYKRLMNKMNAGRITK